MEAKRQYGHEPACRVTKGLELLSPTAGSARPSAPTPNFRTFSLGDVWRQQRRSMETMTVVDNMAHEWREAAAAVDGDNDGGGQHGHEWRQWVRHNCGE